MGRIPFDLPEHDAKPRARGLTNALDAGLGLAEIKDALEICGAYTDVVKLGWGTAHLTPRLEEKLALYKSFDVLTSPGGLMFELSYWQNKMSDYEAVMRDVGFALVEVSNGSLPIPEIEKCREVERLANGGFKVLSEVGSKDADFVMEPKAWVAAIKNDIEAGAWKVIVEGRADASAGIYGSDGKVRGDAVDAILSSGIDPDRLVFEAPFKPQMIYFVTRLGPNVSIGNVPLHEVLNLETLRLGLRGHTVEHFHAPGHESAHEPSEST